MSQGVCRAVSVGDWAVPSIVQVSGDHILDNCNQVIHHSFINPQQPETQTVKRNLNYSVCAFC